MANHGTWHFLLRASIMKDFNKTEVHSGEDIVFTLIIHPNAIQCLKYLKVFKMEGEIQRRS